ncbi:hypothetical protein EDEG_01046 [Edhazardia aedis USNM 41457]|uniref:Uncharacterized protein n=1 Tax=Edhazardia aedis (strain USNM 41457) TaxID=1003232 RepID=J9DAI1_EDHAE|nr:hypothetical protein EDEG_01046 [Edhazardia aedis USNM 41457]|eukprot:EJW04756.1 hypothetical protein EDEG_01046 [Edhazardia aedis USNM 41457]
MSIKDSIANMKLGEILAVLGILFLGIPLIIILILFLNSLLEHHKEESRIEDLLNVSSSEIAECLRILKDGDHHRIMKRLLCYKRLNYHKMDRKYPFLWKNLCEELDLLLCIGKYADTRRKYENVHSYVELINLRNADENKEKNNAYNELSDKGTDKENNYEIVSIDSSTDYDLMTINDCNSKNYESFLGNHQMSVSSQEKKIENNINLDLTHNTIKILEFLLKCDLPSQLVFYKIIKKYVAFNLLEKKLNYKNFMNAILIYYGYDDLSKNSLRHWNSIKENIKQSTELEYFRIRQEMRYLKNMKNSSDESNKDSNSTADKCSTNSENNKHADVEMQNTEQLKK